MSLTIITKNDVDFSTSIGSEHLLGRLCREVNAKHHYFKYSDDYECITIALEMSENECVDTSIKLKTLLNKVDNIYPKYKHYFDKKCNSECLKEFLLEYIEIFEKCGGYKCLD